MKVILPKSWTYPARKISQSSLLPAAEWRASISAHKPLVGFSLEKDSENPSDSFFAKKTW